MSDAKPKVSTEIKFAVSVAAEPQGSIRAFILEGQVDVRDPCNESGKPNWIRKPRAVLTSDNPDLKAYRRVVMSQACNALTKASLPRPMAGKHIAVALEVQFTFIKPPSVSKHRTQMVVRPDADKLVRACLDALTGVLWEDDSQVVEISARKVYGPTERVDVRARILACDDLPTPRLLPLCEQF
jgi:Holliday junction resolvase RusA-like endonuclease